MKKLKFAIIGAGNIGRIHAQAIDQIPEAELLMVYDYKKENGERLANDFKVVCAANLDEILNNPAIDVVNICTPSGTHAEIAIPAALNGKHILAEKPIDITLEKIDQMIEVTATAGVTLAGIFPSRFRIGIQKTLAAIQQGRLGHIIFIQGNIKWFRATEYYQGSWRGTLALDGGGALMNQSIHTIDLIQWMGGPIESIYGKTATLRHTIEAEDTATALLEFKSGAQGIILGATSCWPGDPARIEIHGTKGTIILEEARIIRWEIQGASTAEVQQMLTLDSDTGGGSQDPMGITCEFHQRQIVDLIQALKTNKFPMVDGLEARKAVEIILAIYKSSKAGEKIYLPLNV